MGGGVTLSKLRGVWGISWQIWGGSINLRPNFFRAQKDVLKYNLERWFLQFYYQLRSCEVDIEVFYLKKSVLGGFLAKLSGISSICAENSYQDQIILI